MTAVVFAHDGLIVHKEELPAPIDYLAVTGDAVGIRHLAACSRLEVEERQGGMDFPLASTTTTQQKRAAVTRP